MKVYSLFFIAPLLLNLASGNTSSPAAEGLTGPTTAKSELVALAREKQFDPVGCIKLDGKGIASCVLVAPQWCLTAAHVFDDHLKLKAITIEINGHSRKGVKRIIHRKYKRGNVDLALILLDSAVKDVTPATLYHGKNELNTLSTFVGYGAYGTGMKPDLEVDNPDKLAGTNMIDQIGGSIPGFSTYAPYFLLEDLDYSADTTCCNSLGSAHPVAMEYVPTGGDSGGGLFIEENGKWFLAGIFSEFEFQLASINKTGLYGTVAAFVRVSDFNDWINNYINN